MADVYFRSTGGISIGAPSGTASADAEEAARSGGTITLEVASVVDIEGLEAVASNDFIVGDTTAPTGWVRKSRTDTLTILGFDTDGALSANSDSKFPSQKAVKTYADAKIPLDYLSTDGTFAANSDALVPSQKAAKTYADGKMPASYLDTDGALTANSDVKVASQKATKTYADGKIPKAGNVTAITDTGIADGEIAVFNLTNKDIRTSNAVISTDGTLASNADTNIPTEKAVKTYADLKLAKAGNLSDVASASTARANLGIQAKYISDYADLAAAITAIGSTSCTLVIDANATVAADLAFPATLFVCVLRGAVITVATGTTLTINGGFRAGPYKIFDCAGTGKVSFGTTGAAVFPEWWGAIPDGVTNCLGAIERAIVAAYHGTVQFGYGSYYLGSSTLNIDTSVKLVGQKGRQHYSQTMLISEVTGTTPAIKYYTASYASVWATFMENICIYRKYDVATAVHYSKNPAEYESLWYGTEGVGVLQDTTSETYWKDVHILGFKVGVELDTANIGDFDKCYFAHNNVGVWAGGQDITETRTLGHPYQVVFRAPNFWSNGLAHVAVNGCWNLIFEAPHMEQAHAAFLLDGKYGIVAEPYAGVIAVHNLVIRDGNIRLQGHGGDEPRIVKIAGGASDNIQAQIVMERTLTYFMNDSDGASALPNYAIEAVTSSPSFVYLDVKDVRHFGVKTQFLYGTSTQMHLRLFGRATVKETAAGGGATMPVYNPATLIAHGELYELGYRRNMGPIGETILTITGATPGVQGGNIFKTANTGATTITNFGGAGPGQKIVVLIGDANTTVDFTGTNLKGNAGADWSPANGDWMECVYDGTEWYCSVHDCTA